MKLGDVMTKSPASCSPETNLAAAVEILWNRNCGVLPIVDLNERLVGIVTDRDICVALGTRNQLPGEIPVRDVAAAKIVAGKPDDDLRKALAIMAEAKVRRLPVVDDAGKLQGIVSIDDILLRTGAERSAELSAEDVVRTLRIVHTLRGGGQAKAAAA